MYIQLFIQSLAIIALIIWGASYHFKERKSILLIQLISFVFWVTHFVLLGAYTGAALAAFAAFRLAIFSFKKKDNWIGRPVTMWAFIGALIILTILTANAYWAVFALIGGIFAIIASWQNNQNRIRLLFIPSHLGWIIYDIIAGSYGGAFSEAMLGLSALIGFFKKRSPPTQN